MDALDYPLSMLVTIADSAELGIVPEVLRQSEILDEQRKAPFNGQNIITWNLDAIKVEGVTAVS